MILLNYRSLTTITCLPTLRTSRARKYDEKKKKNILECMEKSLSLSRETIRMSSWAEKNLGWIFLSYVELQLQFPFLFSLWVSRRLNFSGRYKIVEQSHECVINNNCFLTYDPVGGKTTISLERHNRSMLRDTGSKGGRMQKTLKWSSMFYPRGSLSLFCSSIFTLRSSSRRHFYHFSMFPPRTLRPMCNGYKFQYLYMWECKLLKRKRNGYSASEQN